MASIVQSTTISGVYATGSVSTTGITTTSGNLIVIAWASDVEGGTGNHSETTITDSKGNTWTEASGAYNGSSGTGVSFWYCDNIVGGASHTFTTTRTNGFSSGTTALWVWEVSASALGYILSGATNDNTGTTGTSHTTPSVSVTSATGAVFAIMLKTGAGTLTAGSGFTGLAQFSMSGGSAAVAFGESQMVTSATGYTASASSGTSGNWINGIVAFSDNSSRSFTQTGKGRLQKSFTKTQTGKGRIQTTLSTDYINVGLGSISTIPTNLFFF